MRDYTTITLRLALAILFMFLQGCTSKAEIKELAVAEWQFIDAETMQPIEGAFINFAWRGESTSRGMTTCKHGGLLAAAHSGTRT